MVRGIKICGISDLETLRYILNHQFPPKFVGFICNFKKSRRYVEYGILKDLVKIKKLIKKFNLDEKKTISLIIWTTTPWTIPGNQAVCANPEIEYLILDFGNEYSVIASELMESCLNRWSEKTYKSTNISFKGFELENLKVLHPLYKRETPLLFGDHVTTETGTGFVHTAPAHGVDDFNVCSNEEIEVINPIAMNNCYKEDVDFFSGVYMLEKLIHSY